MKSFYTFLLLTLFVSFVHAQVGIGTVSPNSTLDVRGSFSTTYRSFSSTTSVTSTDYTLVFNGGTAATATLPDATTCQGRTYTIKNFSASGAILTLNTVSSQKIDGLASWILDEYEESMTVTSDGGNWQIASQSTPGGTWIEGGNNVASLQTLGTITNFDLPFITHNTERMRITSSGNVGIGSTTFSANPEALLVYQNSATSFNVIGGKGNLNNYLQLNIQNQNSGTNASSDLVATADNGNETTNYVDLGINSSGNTSGSMGNADDAYLYSAGNDFVIGNSIANKNLIFLTGGTSEATNEAMRINGSGNIGIGNNNPSYKLDVNGAIHAGKASATTGSIVYSNSTNANTVTLNSGVTTTTYTLTLPAAQGAANTVLLNNGAGTLTWNTVAAAANTWSTLGNAGTTPGTNFLGTTDNESLVFKTNSVQAGKIDLSLNSTLFGYQAGLGLTSGTNNTAIGYTALKAATTGGNNTALGSAAGITNTTGSNNTFVGTNADATSAALTNASAIGYNAKAAVSNSLILGATGASAPNVGIGVNTFSANPEALLVYQNSSSSFNVIGGKGNLNNYLQLNIQNQNSGAQASSDVVATADNGNETTNYVDMGINSSGYNNAGIMGGANNAYFYSSANDFVIGNSIANKNLIFFTGGTATTNEAMRINSSGQIGVNNTNPQANLDVDGTVKVGTAGTALNAIIRFTNQSVTDNNAITYNQTETETFHLTGVNQYATVIVTPRSTLATGLGIAYAYVPSNNNVQIVINNASGFTQSLGTMAFDITVIQ